MSNHIGQHGTPANQFYETHGHLIALWADQQPVDITATVNMPLTMGRTIVGATTQPPTIWKETTHFVREPNGQVATDRMRVVITPADEAIALSFISEIQDRSPEPDGTLPKRWVGTETTSVRHNDTGALEAIATAVGSLYRNEPA